MQSSVLTIKSRVNRVTKLAPNKVTRKDVPYLISFIFNDSANLIRRPKFYFGDFVRKSKADLPFRKGYKQTITNEVFEIYDIPTTNPPTYGLIDASQEPFNGKFFELDLIKVRHNSSEITKHEPIHGSLSFISLYEYLPSKHLVFIKNYFNEEINLEGDWRVALSEIIFPGKINQVNKTDLKIFSSEGLKFYEKSIPIDAVSRPYGGERAIIGTGSYENRDHLLRCIKNSYRIASF